MVVILKNNTGNRSKISSSRQAVLLVPVPMLSLVLAVVTVVVPVVAAEVLPKCSVL